MLRGKLLGTVILEDTGVTGAGWGGGAAVHHAEVRTGEDGSDVELVLCNGQGSVESAIRMSPDDARKLYDLIGLALR